MSSELEQMDNPFWHFSLKLYQNKELQSLLLDLQERYHLNINCILFAIWLSKTNSVFNKDIFKASIESIKPFQQSITQPIRVIRKRLKKQKINYQNELYEILYQNLLETELACESIQQYELYQTVMSENKLIEMKALDFNQLKQYLKMLFEDEKVFYSLINYLKTLHKK